MLRRLLISLTCVSVAAIRVANASSDEIGSFALEGMWSNLAALERGIVRIEYKLYVDGEVPPMDGTRSHDVAFDYEHGLLRCESIVLGQTHTWLVNREHATIYQPHGQLPDGRPQSVVLYPPDAPCPTAAVPHLDLRILPVGNSIYLQSDHSLSRFEREWSQFPIHEVKFRDSDSPVEVVFRIPITNGPGINEAAFIIDPSRGFIPLAVSQKLFSTGEAEPIGFKATTSTWEERDGINVPTSIVYDEKNPRRRKRVELTLDWESINEPLDESLFTLESLDLPDGTRIVDTRSGQNVVVGMVGEKIFVPQPAPVPIGDRMGTILLTVSLLALAAAVLIAWRRGRRQQA